MGTKAEVEPPRPRHPKPPPGHRERKPRPRAWGRVVGWHLGDDGELAEGITPWHRDALLMVRETASREEHP